MRGVRWRLVVAPCLLVFGVGVLFVELMRVVCCVLGVLFVVVCALCRFGWCVLNVKCYLCCVIIIDWCLMVLGYCLRFVVCALLRSWSSLVAASYLFCFGV